jgi:hypothetical protein
MPDVLATVGSTYAGEIRLLSCKAQERRRVSEVSAVDLLPDISDPLVG